MIPTNLFAATSCSLGNFLGFPHWYQYLKLNSDCSPQLNSINDIWLIVAAVVEILLRLSALMAIVFVVYGGVRYIMSQGEPDKITQARMTIINALAGLVISVVAATVVSFISGGFNR